VHFTTANRGNSLFNQFRKFTHQSARINGLFAKFCQVRFAYDALATLSACGNTTKREAILANPAAVGSIKKYNSEGPRDTKVTSAVVTFNARSRASRSQ
jgi:hypothetical protein